MAKAKKRVRLDVDEDKPPSTVRSFRMDDEVHRMLKEVARAQNRKIGHQLMQIIRDAHVSLFVKITA